MKKALFFHGMGGQELEDTTIQFIRNKFDIEIISPHIQYEMWQGNPHLFPMLKHLASEVDTVCGNSMGGYFAYHIGKMCNLPTLLFNPAISEKTLSYRLFNSITEPVNVDNKVVANLSTLDDVVDHVATRDFLSRHDMGHNIINNLHKQTHSLDYNLILKNLITFTSPTFNFAD